MSRAWSPQQQQIFAWFREGEGHLVVRARAGTGKTTTIVEAVDHAREQSILLAAFNKRIADELSRRLNTPGAEAKTLHSVGFGFVRRYWRNVKLDNGRGERLAQMAIGDQAPQEAVRLVAKIASLGKSVLPIGPTPDALTKIAVEYDKEPSDALEDMGYGLKKIAHSAYMAMLLALEQTNDEKQSLTPTCDFDDMVYLPVANRWASASYGMVCVDEAQDMNVGQLALAQMLVRDRLCIVGDDRQAIYQFRGAKSNAIDAMKKELRAEEIGLTVTFRCAKTIVAYAQKLVPDFTAHETNAEGQILAMQRDKMLEQAEHGDFILSRTNAPLASICLSILRSGRRARIEGREIGSQLSKIVRDRKAKTIEELEEKVAAWRDKAIAKLTRREVLSEDEIRAKRDFIADQAETISALADGVATVEELLTRIDRLFSDADASETSARAAIVCSTIHKSKGLEAERVYVLTETLYPGGDRTKLEERNLEYVAVTRAQKTLVLVVEKPIAA